MSDRDKNGLFQPGHKGIPPRKRATTCPRGHPHTGYTDSRGAQVCLLCRRLKARVWVQLVKHGRTVEAYLREGLTLSPYDVEKVKAWQAKVWQFFDAIETQAESNAADKRRTECGRKRRRRQTHGDAQGSSARP